MYVFYVQYLLKFNVHHSDVFNIQTHQIKATVVSSCSRVIN